MIQSKYLGYDLKHGSTLNFDITSFLKTPGQGRDFFSAMENEILSWLESERDYATGRAIFEKYSRKKPLKNLFRRKYKPDVLLYNLQKLAKAKPHPGPLHGGEGGKKPLDVKPLPGGRKTIVTDKVNYDDLPEHLRKVYDQNRELYKHLRVYHQKMKQAGTDEERAKLRKMVAEYDDVIAGNWKQIDSWDGGDIGDTKEDSVNIEKEVANARKFLSVNVKYLDLREGVKQQLLLFDIKEKAEFLKNHHVTVPKATVEALKKFGIHF